MKKIFLYFIFCFINIAIIHADTTSAIEQIIAAAINRPSQGWVINACEQFDDMVIDQSLKKEIVANLKQQFELTDDDNRKLNIACFLLYFGENYSEYIFERFASFYHLLGGNCQYESDYLDLSQLAGSINTIHAANLKIRIANSITFNGHIYDLTILYAGLSTRDSQYFLYIFANLEHATEALSETNQHLLSRLNQEKEKGEIGPDFIPKLLYYCQLLRENIQYEKDCNGYSPVLYYIYNIYPQILALINYVDASYLLDGDPTGLEPYWLLFNGIE